MKNDIYLTLEKCDLEIQDDLEFDSSSYNIEAYIETKFDVDKKFGLNTAADDGTWVNLYAEYNPFENKINVEYVISSDEENVARKYQPTVAETKMMTMLIEEACVNQMELNCRDALIRNFMEETEKINLICVKKSDNEYQIKNICGKYVLYTEDGTGKLKDHVGHEIEYVKYSTGDDYSFSVECTDCNEVLFAQTDDPYEAVVDEEGVYEYGEYRIIVSPDYKKAIEFVDAPDEVYCKVYAKTDVEFKNCLGEFNMMDGYEYNESTVETIEKGIGKMMEESEAFYELQLRESEFNRADELLARSVSYIAELTGLDTLKDTLINKLDMTETEAESMITDITESQVQEPEMSM